MRILPFILCLLCLRLDAAILYVGNNKPFPNITAAVQAATFGDTIMVNPGIYHEKNLIIDKPITLMGVDFPILDGENLYEVISIKADYVRVEGFTIRRSGVSSIIDYAGIKIYNRSWVAVVNNNVEDCFFGIYVQNGTNCLVANNRLKASAKTEQQSGNGIHCWKSDKLYILLNTITGHRDGIYFEFVTHSEIRANQSFQNMRYGLHFMFSNNDSYFNNSFSNNGAGVAVMFSKGIQMTGNYFSKNQGDAAYGILLKEISDSHINHNLFKDNTTAILAEGSSRIEMKNNRFVSNGWALKIQASCMEITVNDNNFIGNSFDIGTNGSLVLNNFNNNYWDKYEGYDLNKDKIGDIPYRPVSMFSMVVERNPAAMMLFRSLISTVMDKSEKIAPSLTPENLMDNQPLMKPVEL